MSFLKSDFVATFNEGRNCYHTLFNLFTSKFLNSKTFSEVFSISNRDILVNNAGYRTPKAFGEIEDDELERTMQVNFMGGFRCTREAIRLMSENARVIFIASVDASRPGAKRTDYGSSKAAEIMLMKNLALELSDRKILVNAVSPGAIDTDMTSMLKADNGTYERTLKGIPLGRFGEVNEIAGMVAFLASDYGSYITGTNIIIDGGLSLMRGY